MMTSKAVRELAFFQSLQRALPELASVDARHADRPDIRVSLDGDRVGIEITELLVSDDLRAHESLTDLIVRTAKETYHAQERWPLLVNVFLAPRLHFGKRHATQLGREIGMAVAQRADRHTVARIPKDDLPRGVSHVWFAPLIPGGTPVWCAVAGGFMPDVDGQQLANRIRSKSERAPAYRAECDRLWLLVVLPGYRPSEWFGLEGEALTRTYPSSFDRVYLLDAQQDRTVRLATTDLSDR